jgi:hypothetical protein
MSRERRRAITQQAVQQKRRTMYAVPVIRGWQEWVELHHPRGRAIKQLIEGDIGRERERVRERRNCESKSKRERRECEGAKDKRGRR